MFLSLENAAELSDRYDAASSADRDRTLARLLELIQRLAPPDRQLMLLLSDGCDAATIAEVAEDLRQRLDAHPPHQGGADSALRGRNDREKDPCLLKRFATCGRRSRFPRSGRARTSLRRFAAHTGRRLFWGNVVEYVAGALGIAAFAFYIWHFKEPGVKVVHVA